MYKCKHFIIQELVDPETYREYGERCWKLFDDRLLKTIDQLREKFGPVVVNNWHGGGLRKWSGIRTSKSPYFSQTSQHSFGRAADCLFINISVDEVRQYILKNPDEFPYITGIELNVSWLHFDVGNRKKIETFSP